MRDLAAQHLLELADELEAAEVRIKETLLAAARDGDVDLVIQVLTQWIENPPNDVEIGT